MEKAMLQQAERERTASSPSYDAAPADLPPSYSEATNTPASFERQYHDPRDYSQAWAPQQLPFHPSRPQPSLYREVASQPYQTSQRHYYDQGASFQMNEGHHYANDMLSPGIPPPAGASTNPYRRSSSQHNNPNVISQGGIPQQYPPRPHSADLSSYAAASTKPCLEPPNQYQDPRASSSTDMSQQRQGYPGSSLSPNPSPYAGSISSPPTLPQPSDDEVLAQALKFTNHPAPAFAAHTRLGRPVVVPQVKNGIGMPFSRAYSPALQAKGISIQEFVEFIDNLNVVSTASPPLQILDLAGGVVGMVPHHIPQLVGNALSLTAKLGTVAVSKGRVAMFLSEANKKFFTPRGLRVELVASKVLKERLGLHPDTDLVSALDESAELNVQARRMRALEQYTSPLTFDVPPPTEQTNVLERLSAGQVARQLKKSEKKTLEDREKALKKSGKNSDSGKQSKAEKDLDKEMAKLEKERSKIEKEFEKEMGKLEKDRSKSSWQRDVNKAERKRQEELDKLDREMEKTVGKSEKEASKDRKDAKKEDKEVEAAEKVMWVLVEDIPGSSEGKPW